MKLLAKKISTVASLRVSSVLPRLLTPPPAKLELLAASGVVAGKVTVEPGGVFENQGATAARAPGTRFVADPRPNLDAASHTDHTSPRDQRSTSPTTYGHDARTVTRSAPARSSTT